MVWIHIRAYSIGPDLGSDCLQRISAKILISKKNKHQIVPAVVCINGLTSGSRWLHSTFRSGRPTIELAFTHHLTVGILESESLKFDVYLQ